MKRVFGFLYAVVFSAAFIVAAVMSIPLIILIKMSCDKYKDTILQQWCKT